SRTNPGLLICCRSSRSLLARSADAARPSRRPLHSLCPRHSSPAPRVERHLDRTQSSGTVCVVERLAPPVQRVRGNCLRKGAHRIAPHEFCREVEGTAPVCSHLALCEGV